MRLSTLTVTALPFVLLAAMLTSIVVSPRLQSHAASHDTRFNSQPVTELPLVRVNATIGKPVNSLTDGLARQWVQSASLNCAWIGNDLRMPYFSFAKPLLTTHGI